MDPGLIALLLFVVLPTLIILGVCGGHLLKLYCVVAQRHQRELEEATAPWVAYRRVSAEGEHLIGIERRVRARLLEGPEQLVSYAQAEDPLEIEVGVWRAQGVAEDRNRQRRELKEKP